MCETCGCGDTNLVPVEIQESLLAHNDAVAAHYREHFRRADGNSMKMPGSFAMAVDARHSR